MKKGFFFMGIFTATVLLLATVSTGEAQQAKKTTLRWGSSKAGSAGYVTLFGVAKIVNDRAPDLYIEAVPTGGSIASQRMMAKGELEGCYSGTWNFLDIYFNRGPYAKSPYPPGAVKPYQTWHCYLVEEFVVTRANRTDIKSWRDLAGKKVFVPVPGSSVFEVPRAAFTALGIWDKMKVVELPFTALPDALNMGTIDAAVGYANGKVLIPWMAEVDSRVKVRVVNPAPEELEVIKKVSGYSVASLNVKKAFSQDVGVAAAHTISDYYGFHIGKNLPAKYAHRIFQILVENAKEVAKVHAMLEEYANDPLGMQIKAANSIPEIPVHPGVADYLKEKGVWKKEFKIGKE